MRVDYRGYDMLRVKKYFCYQVSFLGRDAGSGIKRIKLGRHLLTVWIREYSLFTWANGGGVRLLLSMYIHNPGNPEWKRTERKAIKYENYMLPG